MYIACTKDIFWYPVFHIHTCTQLNLPTISYHVNKPNQNAELFEVAMHGVMAMWDNY